MSRSPTSLSLPEALHDFVVEYLEPANASPNTTRAYTSDVLGVARFAAAALRPDARGLTGKELARLSRERITDSDVDALTIDDLTASVLRRAFGAWTQTHAVSSAQRAHTAWNRLFDHLAQVEVVDGNRMAAVPKPRDAAATDEVTGRGDDVRSLPGDPVVLRDALLEAAANPRAPDDPLQASPATRVPIDRDPWPQRDVALVATFLWTGARLSEVCDLNNGSLSGLRRNRTITLIGKGRKRRQVAVSHRLEDHLDAYRASPRHAEVASQDGPAPLLVANDGRRLRPHQVQYRIWKLYRQTGIDQARSPGALVHALRHTVATQLVERGVPTPAVQEFLGHASQDTTMKYVRRVAADQRRILDALD